MQSTLRIDYAVDGNKMAAVFNTATIRSWMIQYVPKLYKVAPHYKIEVVLLPRKVIDGGEVVEVLDSYTYVFSSYELATRAVSIVANEAKNIPATPTPSVPTTVAANVNKPIPTTVQNTLPAKSVAPTLAPKGAAKMMKVETKQQIATAPNKVETTTVIKSVDSDAPLEQVTVDSDIRKMDFPEWSKSCMVAKEIYMVKDILKFSRDELKFQIGVKAVQEILVVLEKHGFKFKNS